ncbi:MAG: hypothetical protein IJ065_05695 [Eubacterium sp.]|nr:hypothetical protein [Eubacterium sp.]
MVRRLKVNKKMMGLMCAALMIAGNTGCEKKAETVSGMEEVTESVVTQVGTEEEKAKESGTAASEPAEPQVWADTYSFDEPPFNEVKVSVKVKDYSQEPVSVVKAELRDYDKDFMKDMCDNVFEGEPEVFDYSVRTKRICDADIQMFTDVKNMLHSDDVTVRELYVGFDDTINPDRDYEKELEEEVDSILGELEEEKKSAEETVQNDYSYGGYIGSIGGEEYIMYFGNRHHDEYVEAPLGFAIDGRVCTIYRSDMRDFFDGEPGTIGEVNTPSFNDGTYPENLLGEAEEFVKTIGFGDYLFSGDEPTRYYHMHGYDTNFYVYRGLPAVLQSQASEGEMGYVFTFVPGGGKDRVIEQGDIWFELYTEDHNTMNVNTYIKVYVSENGVAACQMVNPVKITSIEAASKIISANDAKDIIMDNINNADAWNIQPENAPVSVECTELRLINFPIRSEENRNEYTYVPAYIFYGNLYDPMLENHRAPYDMPCMIINALDGNFIKVKDNLGDPYSGYARGNEGYDELMNGSWENHNITWADIEGEGIVEQKDAEDVTGAAEE